jgi:putative ABC transport system permease protein
LVAFYIELLIVLVGCLAGLYPALVLSSQSSVDSLKGRGGSKENVLLRKGLVVFQFATATIVFVGAIIISQQIRLFFSDRLGYNKDWIVSAQLPRDWTNAGVRKMSSIRDAFSRTAGVKNATLSFEIPNGGNGGSNSAWREGSDSSRALVA